MKKQTYEELNKRVKELEKAKAESMREEAILRLQSEVVENMTEGVYLIRTSDGMIVYANPTFEKMFGYDSGELINKHVSIVNAPGEKSSEEIAKEIIQSLNKKGTWSGEVRNIKKDGTSFWCHATVSTFVHPDYGEVWVSVHEDITKRKQLEEELKKQHDNLEKLVDERTAELRTANEQLKKEITERKKAEEKITELAKFPGENPNPVLRIAKNGTIIYANEASQPLLSVWRCQVGQLLPDHWRKYIQDVFNSGSRKDAEVDCEGRIISLTLTPIMEAEYVNVYGLDITDRKKLEEEKIKISNIEAINKLIVTLNHEMNQPLSVIISYASFIMDDAEKENKLYKDARLINDEAWKISNLVKKIGKLKEIKTSEYTKGTKMIDLSDIDKGEGK